MSRRDCWTREDVGRFLVASSGTRLEAAWCLITLAGLRVGELLALRWADVDLDAGEIHVENAVPGVAYAAISAAPIAARARVVEIDPALCATLSRHRARQSAERSEWDEAYAGHDLVVCREDGRALRPRQLHRAFQRLARRQNLRPVGLPAFRRSARTPARAEIAA